MRSVCVFCGSSLGRRPEYAEAAKALGRLIADRDLTLIYGGANCGLMGVVADACLASGGRVIGVMPRFLADHEIAHRGLTELHIVESMHQRKALMAALAEAFIALPGGLGTLEEYLEILTWTQLGLQRKPCGLLNLLGYFDPLLAQADRAVEEGFARPEHRKLLVAVEEPGSLLEALAQTTITLGIKWIEADGT